MKAVRRYGGIGVAAIMACLSIAVGGTVAGAATEPSCLAVEVHDADGQTRVDTPPGDILASGDGEIVGVFEADDCKRIVKSAATPEAPDDAVLIQFVSTDFFSDDAFALVVKNPNASHAVVAQGLDVTARDAQGAVVGEASASISVGPGGTAARIGFIEAGSEAATLEVRLDGEPQYIFDDIWNSGGGGVEVDEVQTSRHEMFPAITRGTLRNTTDETKFNVTLDVIYSDENDVVKWAHTTIVSFVPGLETAPFEIVHTDGPSAEDIDKTQAYVREEYDDDDDDDDD